MKKTVLAGDIGGTKTVMGLFQYDDDGLIAIEERTYVSKDYPGPGPMMSDILSSTNSKIDHACLGIAGPVSEGEVTTPNLPWTVSAIELAAEVDLERVELVNDLVAMAYGVLNLPDDDLLNINPNGKVKPGNAVLLAPGTGLGQALLFWDGSRYTPSPTEAGHGDFAPTDEDQVELLRFLWREDDHISYDKVGTGPGLYSIYRFVTETGREKAEPLVAAEMKNQDKAAVISNAAMNNRCPACVKALDIMIRVIGSECGNMALRCLALNGVYLGGGIPPKILPAIRDGRFMEAFKAKGRMSGLMAEIPVKVILNPKTPLLGAAFHAAAL